MKQPTEGSAQQAKQREPSSMQRSPRKNKTFSTSNKANGEKPQIITTIQPHKWSYILTEILDGPGMFPPEGVEALLKGLVAHLFLLTVEGKCIWPSTMMGINNLEQLRIGPFLLNEHKCIVLNPNIPTSGCNSKIHTKRSLTLKWNTCKELPGGISVSNNLHPSNGKALLDMPDWLIFVYIWQSKLKQGFKYWSAYNDT